MSVTPRAKLGIVVGALLVAASVAIDPGRGSSDAYTTPLLRLIGPMREFAANVQWVRYQRARLHGEDERAIRAAEGALALDPGATDGWILLASHLAFFRSSVEREPDLERRRAWFRAGLQIASRGADRARDPGALHYWRAALLLSKVESDPDVAPGGAEQLVREAKRALDEAAAAGHSLASEFATYVDEATPVPDSN